jgi:hypothetical protein
MPYPPKPPTPQIVGAILKRAGFNRSQSSGVYVRTAGYAVRKSRTQPDAVEVRWWPDLPDLREVAPDADDDITGRRYRWLQRYADAITTDALYHGRFVVRFTSQDGKVTVYLRRPAAVVENFKTSTDENGG